MIRPTLSSGTCGVAIAAAICAGSTGAGRTQTDGWRTLEIETREVTAPDIALSPDGSRLAFTLLGHLFLVPVDGGDAQQLTTGPYQHRDPTFSADGQSLAFASNRDGSDGNIFTMDLASGAIAQVTDEREAARPAFSPDGGAIVYLSLLEPRGHHCPEGVAALKRISLGTATGEELTEVAGAIRSAFYLRDGRLAWTEHVRGTTFNHRDDRTVVRSLDGAAAETLGTIDAIADRVVPHPDGTGFFARARQGTWVPEHLSLTPVGGNGRSDVTTLSPQPCFYGSGAFAVGSDGDTAYLGDVGRLWRVSIAQRTRVPIPFRARVRLEIRDPVPVPALPAPIAGEGFSARSLQTPVRSPGRNHLAFGAGGALWIHDGDAGVTRRLSEDDAFQRDPAYSPDGRRLAFVWSDGWRPEIRMLDVDAGETETLAAGAGYWHPAWSPDGARVVFAEAMPDSAPQLVVVNVTDRARTVVPVDGLDDWSAHPQFGPEGQSVYYAAAPAGESAIYRVSLEPASEPVRITSPGIGPVHRPTLSPDGERLLFRRNSEIWSGRLEDGVLVDDSAFRLSERGGDEFAITPDGDAVTFANGRQVWQLPVSGGPATAVPLSLEFRSPVPQPLLIQQVRLLDFAAGGFTDPTSVYIEGGRIRSIGPAGAHRPAADVRTLNAAGRFAIPGLIDMHAHIQRHVNGAWLAYGITSLRDVGGPVGWIAALADRSEGFDSQLPRLFFSGDIIHGMSTSLDPIHVASRDEVQRLVRELKERGVHFIKTHPGLSWSAQQALVDEARRLELPVVEHATPLPYLYQSVTLGSTFVEHARADFRYQDDVQQLLAQAGTGWTPTLAVTGAPSVGFMEDPERWVDEKLRGFASPTDVQAMLSYGVEDDRRILNGILRSAQTALRDGWDTGVRYYAGTDAPAWMVIPGTSLHQEIDVFAGAGIPAIDVLRMATLDAARALGAGDWLGSLAPDRMADIVLLDGNPLDDIRHTRDIWRVVTRGRLVDPTDLRR